MPRPSPDFLEAVHLFRDEIVKSKKNDYFDYSVVLENSGSIAIFFENIKNRLLHFIETEIAEGAEKNYYETVGKYIRVFPKYAKSSDFLPEKEWKRFHEKSKEFDATWVKLDEHIVASNQFPCSYEELTELITSYLSEHKKLYSPKLVPALITYRAFETKKEFCDDIEYIVKSHQDSEYSLDEEFAAQYPELVPALVTPNLDAPVNALEPLSYVAKYSIDTAVLFRDKQKKDSEKSANLHLEEAFTRVKRRAERIYASAQFVESIEKSCRDKIEAALLAL